MSALQIIFGVILLLFSVGIVFVVLLQEGDQQNLGAITGGADTFLSKNKARLMRFSRDGQNSLQLDFLSW